MSAPCIQVNSYHIRLKTADGKGRAKYVAALDECLDVDTLLASYGRLEGVCTALLERADCCLSSKACRDVNVVTCVIILYAESNQRGRRLAEVDVVSKSITAVPGLLKSFNPHLAR